MKITFNRTFLMRLIAIVIVIVIVLLFAVMLFFIGKQHIVLLDNKTITVNGEEIKAMKMVEVQVNKLDSLEFVPRDRDKVAVKCQKHTITMKFRLPLMEEMAIISIPALVANTDAPQSVWFEKYELPTYAMQAAPEDEVIVTDDLAGLLSL